MGCFDGIQRQIIIDEDRAADGADEDGVVHQTVFGQGFGHQTVGRAVVAAGTVMHGPVGQHLGGCRREEEAALFGRRRGVRTAEDFGGRLLLEPLPHVARVGSRPRGELGGGRGAMASEVVVEAEALPEVDRQDVVKGERGVGDPGGEAVRVGGHRGMFAPRGARHRRPRKETAIDRRPGADSRRRSGPTVAVPEKK